jgi:hypothetical protein
MQWLRLTLASLSLASPITCVYETEDDAARALDRMLIKLLGDDATSHMLNVRSGTPEAPNLLWLARLLNAS